MKPTRKLEPHAGEPGDANAVKAALKSQTTPGARSRTRAAPRRARGRGWASRQGQPHRGRRGPLRPDQGPSRASRARGQGGHDRPLKPLGFACDQETVKGAAMNPSEASGSWSGRPDLNRRPQRPERCALNQLRYSPTETIIRPPARQRQKIARMQGVLAPCGHDNMYGRKEIW